MLYNYFGHAHFVVPKYWSYGSKITAAISRCVTDVWYRRSVRKLLRAISIHSVPQL